MYVVYINLLYFLSIFLFTYNKNLLSPKNETFQMMGHSISSNNNKFIKILFRWIYSIPHFVAFNLDNSEIFRLSIKDIYSETPDICTKKNKTNLRQF